MQQWDVWQLDQMDARQKSDPSQPPDPTKKIRFFVIISNNAHLKTAPQVTCIPISKNDLGLITSILIKAKPSGVYYDSYAHCHTIVTVPKNSFLGGKRGHVKKAEQAEIQQTIKEYLSLL